MPKGKQIGNAFENVVAKQIRKKLKATRREVYRTPSSGAHPCIGRMDVVVDAKYARLWPWNVECKKSRAFVLSHLLSPTAQMQSWAKQTEEQANAEKKKPLLVFRGLRTPIYAGVVEGTMSLRESNYIGYPYVRIRLAGALWRIYEWADLLRLL